jgi:nitrite reductase/ring-hydroxylating ferredoxin subunit
MALVYVGKQSDFEDRGRKVVARGDLEIGVFRLADEFYAYENRCPHVRGPVCQGRILPRVEEVLAEDKTSRGQKWSEHNTHIVCPWHGWEFDLKTGRHPGNPHMRLRAFDVTIKGDEVYIVV